MEIYHYKPDGGQFGGDWWAIVADEDGNLFAGHLEAGNEAAALAEAEKETKYTVKAVCEYIHPAYNMVDSANFDQGCADKILDYVSPLIGQPYAVKDIKPKPAKWVGEKFEGKEKDEAETARREAGLELACEEGEIPGAL